MNQDQVKQKLLELRDDVPDFSVIFSGKKSKRVDGLYHPDSCEIIIHNHNFEDDGGIMYTAIHEFAHHVQFSGPDAPASARAHTTHFYDIFHRLLFEAEKKGIYRNVFKEDRRFVDLTQQIKEHFLSSQGQMIKDFGRLLLDASELCREVHASFEDYLNRELGLQRSAAGAMMKIHTMDINPKIGYDNMKMVASVRDPERARMAEMAFLSGQTPEMVKAEFSPRQVSRSGDRMADLLQEKNRIEKDLDRLTARLAQVERKIQDLRLGE